MARNQAERIGEVLGVAEVDCKYGIGIAQQMIQNAKDVENLSEGQARMLKIILKKRDKEIGGKMKGKATAAAKPCERPRGMGGSGLGAEMGTG